MNPELKERNQEQIDKQIMAILKEKYIKQITKSSIVRTTTIKCLLKYYFNKYYWSLVGIIIGLTIYNIIQIWFGN